MTENDNDHMGKVSCGGQSLQIGWSELLPGNRRVAKKQPRTGRASELCDHNT